MTCVSVVIIMEKKDAGTTLEVSLKRFYFHIAANQMSPHRSLNQIASINKIISIVFDRLSSLEVPDLPAWALKITYNQGMCVYLNVKATTIKPVLIENTYSSIITRQGFAHRAISNIALCMGYLWVTPTPWNLVQHLSTSSPLNFANYRYPNITQLLHL